MELQPGKYYPIVRQIPDPNDTATYYVRAVIRNALTGATISTQNLTDAGSGRHYKSWQVEGNVPEDGLWITITTTVYTDSGYTTKSAIYSEELEQYLIIPRAANFGGGGGGGGSISYERIQDLLEQSLKKFDKGDGAATQLELALRQLATAIKDASVEQGRQLSVIESAIKDIPTTDLEPVLERIADIPQTDLEPIAELVRKVHAKVPAPVDYDKIISVLKTEIFDQMEARIHEAMKDFKKKDRAALELVLQKMTGMRETFLSGFGESEALARAIMAGENPEHESAPKSTRELIRSARTRS